MLMSVSTLNPHSTQCRSLPLLQISCTLMPLPRYLLPSVLRNLCKPPDIPLRQSCCDQVLYETYMCACGNYTGSLWNDNDGFGPGMWDAALVFAHCTSESGEGLMQQCISEHPASQSSRARTCPGHCLLAVFLRTITSPRRYC